MDKGKIIDQNKRKSQETIDPENKRVCRQFEQTPIIAPVGSTQENSPATPQPEAQPFAPKAQPTTSTFQQTFSQAGQDLEKTPVVPLAGRNQTGQLDFQDSRELDILSCSLRRGDTIISEPFISAGPKPLLNKSNDIIRLDIPAHLDKQASSYELQNLRFDEAFLTAKADVVNDEKVTIIMFWFRNDTDFNETLHWYHKIPSIVSPEKFLVKAYNLPFYDQSGVVDELRDTINQAATNWATNHLKGTFAPFVTICQSSGYGKSRTIKEIAREQNSVFLCLRQDKGVPNRSPLASSFIDAMNELTSATKMVYSLVHCTVKAIEAYKKNNPKATKKETAEYLFMHQPWDYFGDEITDASLMKKYRSFQNEVYEYFTSLKEPIDQAYSLPEEWANYFHQGGSTLVIFLDDAGSLLEDSNTSSDRPETSDDNFEYDQRQTLRPSNNRNRMSRFRILRRAAQQRLQGIRVVFVLTDTGMPLSEFELEKFTKSIVPLVKLNKPFYSFSYIDQLASRYLDEFKQNSDLYGHLKSRDPFQTVFLLGRPLWPSLLQTRYVDTVALAVEKILGVKDWSLLLKKDKVSASLAILAIITTITPKLGPSTTNQLVAKHMTTLYGVNSTCNQFLFRYISEPILAEASARILKKESTFVEVFKSLNDFLQSASSLDFLGPVGEFVSQIVLLKAFDRQFEHLVTRPRTVESFLKSLVGEDNYSMYFFNNRNCLVNETLLKGLVCFTYFIKNLDEELNYQYTLQHLVARAAAGQFKDNTKGFDLFIPVVLPNNQLTYILFQIKTTKRRFKAVTDLPSAVQADWFKPSNPPIQAKDRKDYFILVMNMAQDHYGADMIEQIPMTKRQIVTRGSKTNVTNIPPATIQQDYAFSLNGFNNYLYPFLSEQQLSVLRQVLDYQRFETNTLNSESTFVKQVMTGSISNIKN